MKLTDVFQAITNSEEKYIFIDDHPVDRGRPKYHIYNYWYNQDRLHCFACGRKAVFFRMVACKGAKPAGAIHKPTGKRKYTIQLYSKRGVLFTLDHWYPKWFLKKYGLWNSIDNMVPMCEACNQNKKEDIPILGMFGVSFHIPTFLGPQIRRSLHTKMKYV